MDSEDQYTKFYIPPNFANGLSIFGRTYPFSRVRWAVIFGFLPVMIFYYVLPECGISFKGTARLTLVLSLCFVMVLFGLSGINDSDAGQFIRDVIRWRRNRRTAYYNPRIKTEIRPAVFSGTAGAGEILPRERIEQMMEQFKSRMDENDRRHAQLNMAVVTGFDNSTMYFEDDAAVSGMTEEKSRRESRRLRKIRKAEERERKKAERRKRNGKAQRKGAARASYGKAEKRHAAGEHGPAEFRKID